MPSSSRSVIFFLLIPFALLHAQQPKPFVAPVPAQISTAKRVFISNAGTDPIMMPALRAVKDPNRTYNLFFQTMKTWGRYGLASSPVDADLVIEISLAVDMTDCGKLTTFQQQLRGRIFDAKTHFLLWTLNEPVEGAVRKSTWEKNLQQGMDQLISDWEQLATAAPSTGNNTGQ